MDLRKIERQNAGDTAVYAVPCTGSHDANAIVRDGELVAVRRRAGWYRQAADNPGEWSRCDAKESRRFGNMRTVGTATTD